jgi:transposase
MNPPEHNTHIHKPKNDIDAMVKRIEYRSIHLTLYSPELNTIEQF